MNTYKSLYFPAQSLRAGHASGSVLLALRTGQAHFAQFIHSSIYIDRGRLSAAIPGGQPDGTCAGLREIKDFPSCPKRPSHCEQNAAELLTVSFVASAALPTGCTTSRGCEPATCRSSSTAKEVCIYIYMYWNRRAPSDGTPEHALQHRQGCIYIYMQTELTSYYSHIQVPYGNLPNPLVHLHRGNNATSCHVSLSTRRRAWRLPARALSQSPCASMHQRALPQPAETARNCCLGSYSRISHMSRNLTSRFQAWVS